MKIALVLFNLGGPDSPEAVEPFLRNLFSDPAVIDLPAFVRKPIARFVARKRAPVAQAIYARIGGRSPILDETLAQASALEKELGRRRYEARAFVAMRCWRPFSDEAAKAIKMWGADKIVLLPLYPQFSTTTTASSLTDWHRAARENDLDTPAVRVCCYPWEKGFVTALAELIHKSLTKRKSSVDYRLLLSAHGLPKRTVAKGDPYQWQVERTADALVDLLGEKGLDWQICYQSRVGPLEWIGPATEAEIRRAGAEGKGVIIVPIAFVSEHSETLVELDIEYAALARDHSVPDYLRVPAVGANESFIRGLADLVVHTLEKGQTLTCANGRLCPKEFRRCGYEGAGA